MAKIVTENGHTFVRDEWWAQDILDQAELDEEKLTKKQVTLVMEYLVETYDANDGINFETVSDAISTIKARKR
jgi:hypothetical protein